MPLTIMDIYTKQTFRQLWGSTRPYQVDSTGSGGPETFAQRMFAARAAKRARRSAQGPTGVQVS
jgi:hypothetical protein